MKNIIITFVVLALAIIYNPAYAAPKPKYGLLKALGVGTAVVGAGWIGHSIGRREQYYRDRYYQTPGQQVPPSNYFQGQGEGPSNVGQSIPA